MVGIAPSVKKNGVLERYQWYAGREETRRERDWLGRTRKIYYIDIWEERLHCQGCGVDLPSGGLPGPAQPPVQPRENRQEDPKTTARNKDIFESLKTDQFREAESQIRELQMQDPGNSSDLELLKYLDQALNGQGRIAEADAVANNLRSLWRSNVRNQWIAEGRPMQGSVHSRLILNHHKDYHVLAEQYYECEMQKEKGGFSKAIFKVVAFPKDGRSLANRLFKLEEAVAGGQFVLKEHFNDKSSEAVRFYKSLVAPDIREVAGHAVDHLKTPQGSEPCRTKVRTSLPEAIRSVAGRHLPVAYAKVANSEEESAVPECDMELTETSESLSTSHHDIV